MLPPTNLFFIPMIFTSSQPGWTTTSDVGDRHQKRSPEFYWTHRYHFVHPVEQGSEVTAKLQLGWNVRIWDVGTGLMTKKFKGHWAQYIRRFSAQMENLSIRRERIESYGFGTSIRQKLSELSKVIKQKSHLCCSVLTIKC